jgi:general secretion pathway protein D
MQKTPTHRSSRTAIALMAAASTMPAVTSTAAAQDASYSSLAQREMIRRQNDVREGDRLLTEGREAYAKGDFQMAVDKYKQALDRVPNAPLLADRRQSYIAHLSDASVALAMQHRKVGKYPEARALLETVISKDPNNLEAKRELEYLDDPIRTNPALTYEHTQNVDKVRRGLYTAEGHYNLGKFDDARREYENVLRIDPYNAAARRGMERVANGKSDYNRAAYDHTRAELLSQVDAAWALSVPAEAPQITGDSGEADAAGRSGMQYINEKLRRIVIPRIDFEDTTVEEAVNFLRQRAFELDTTELDPSKKGVNFVVRRPRAASLGAAAPSSDSLDAAAAGGGDALPAAAADPSQLRIKELRIKNVPLEVALKYICDQTKLKVKVDNFAVTLVPQQEATDEKYTRTFSVPPDFYTQLGAGSEGGAAAAPADPFSDSATTTSATRITARPPIVDLLKKSGVNFTEGTSATLSGSGVLMVTNTPNELDKIEQLVNEMKGKQPKQIKITTKFVEITQENGEELGFDWIVGPFGDAAGNIFGGGGTIGNGTPRTNADFISPVNYTSIPGVPATPDQNVTNTLTGGNRSGDYAVTRNSIDAILNNPTRNSQNSSVAPGIMHLTGLFTDGQLQMIMRGLSQKKGADLMTAPSVTAKSGQKAKIEIIREFIYPGDYEPPELPNSVGTNSFSSLGSTGIGSSGSSFPVTPATPTAWETRNTGVTLEVEPSVGEDGFLIDLRFIPEVVEFEGFINYGSPISTSGTDALGTPTQIVITENRIEMPVFSTRRVDTQLTIYDGYTVAIGGLMREDVQTVEDKVPIFGDIPVLGRLFQTKADNRIKSNLIVFVTAQIIDATGRPLRGNEASEPTNMPTAMPTTPSVGDPSVLPPL